MLRVPVFISALVAALVLSGCVFAPGQHLDTADLAREQSPEAVHAQLVPITPKLLAIQASARNNDVLPVDLLNYVPDTYRIGPNDVLHITVWDHPEMTVPAGPQQTPEANGRVVRPDGSLFYPYIGTVKAAGLTVEELSEMIAQRLTKVITKPQVDVAVLRYGSRKVVLSGAFMDTTQQPVTSAPLSLLEAVGKAGVKSVEADLSSLTLKRNGREYRLDLDALNRTGATLDRIYLKDGDQLHLAYNDRRRVYVMGEVAQPRALPYRTRDLNLSDVIGSVGGLRQETANGKAVYVIRGAGDLERESATVFQLDAASPTAFALAERFMLEPQDVVYVGPAGITRWNRFVSQLFPSANLLSTGIRMEQDVRSR